jgi:MFS family permease
MPLSEPDHAHRSPRLGPTVLALGREIWALVRSRTGGIAIFLLLLPLGTGAASNLFPAIAKDYGASAGMVALVTGVLSGLVQIPGSLAGGYLADRLGRRPIYWGGALAMALCALLMAAAPRSPVSFAVGTLAYAVTLGVIWGAYSGVVYAAAGGAGAATKCNVLSSLCNIPIAAMTALDGWAQTRWGTAAMLGVEGVVAVGAVGFYLAVLQVVSRPGRGGVGAAAETLS